VLGGAGDDLRALDAQRLQILKKRLLEARRVLADGMPAAAALRMILSSTSVMFMTWRTWVPVSLRKRRSTSICRKVRKLPMWP
jgi:hypothetical protein